jgi:hypothetical protein
MNVWSWLVAGIGAWTVFAFAVAIGIGRALRRSRDLPAAGRLISLHPDPIHSPRVADNAIVGAP